MSIANLDTTDPTNERPPWYVKWGCGLAIAITAIWGGLIFVYGLISMLRDLGLIQ